MVSGYDFGFWPVLFGCVFEVCPAPGAREGPQKGGGGAAPHIFEGSPGPPGPARPQKCTPKSPARLPSGTQGLQLRLVSCLALGRRPILIKMGLALKERAHFQKRLSFIIRVFVVFVSHDWRHNRRCLRATKQLLSACGRAHARRHHSGPDCETQAVFNMTSFWAPGAPKGRPGATKRQARGSSMGFSSGSCA